MKQKTSELATVIENGSWQVILISLNLLQNPILSTEIIQNRLL